MSEQKLTIGMDRFIAKRWADYAFDLRSSPIQGQNRYVQLQEWLSQEIKGKEVVEKTASQLRRIWLAEDRYDLLRRHAVEFGSAQDPSSLSVLHYGLSLNVFPFFRDLCATVGRLIQLQGKCQGKEVRQRLLEKYQSKATVSYAARRGLLTLVDWGLLTEEAGYFRTNPIQVINSRYSVWFIQSLLQNYPAHCAGFIDLINFPENLGIIIPDPRSIIRETDNLFLERNGRNEEIIMYREEV
jgi:hypothetical protein